jgi:hypothetical protein
MWPGEKKSWFAGFTKTGVVISSATGTGALKFRYCADVFTPFHTSGTHQFSPPRSTRPTSLFILMVSPSGQTKHRSFDERSVWPSSMSLPKAFFARNASRGVLHRTRPEDTCHTCFFNFLKKSVARAFRPCCFNIFVNVVKSRHCKPSSPRLFREIVFLINYGSLRQNSE